MFRFPRTSLALFIALCVAMLAFASPAAAQHDLALDIRDPGAEPRIAVFRAAGFPTVDAPEIPDATLDAALAGLDVDVFATSDALAEGLRLRSHDLLILTYGSAFPVGAWHPVRTFLDRGGSLVVLGGAPFHQPVIEDGNGSFRLGVRQTTFAHQLLIGPADLWQRSEAGPDLRTVAVAESEWQGTVDVPERVWIPIIRLASVADQPGEHGSEGYRDAVQRPLVQVVDDSAFGGAGLPVATPIFEIDHLRGGRHGARWVLAPSDARLSAELIRKLVLRARRGALDVDALPNLASLRPGEVPQLDITVRRPFVRAGEAPVERADVVVKNDDGEPVFRAEVLLEGEPELRSGVLTVGPVERPLAPGLYHVEISLPDAPSAPSRTTAGFWVRDDELLRSGPKVTVSRDWLRKDGAVFPIIGTTYMASDVQRKFLIEPNPHVWDRDFAQMAKLGIGFVRTGTWTGHTRSMLGTGGLDEAFVRSLEAYVQTAAKHGIVVNYTFYAFLPLAHGADNPYLDPRALDGQRQLLTQVASRFRGVGWVHWDLINEPSYAPPEHVWQNAPIGDRFEKREWLRFLEERHGLDEELLRSRWQDPTEWIWEVPHFHEQFRAALRQDKRPRKMRDFMVLSNEIVAGWAARLRDILKEAGGDDVLVTLGQDEGGTFTRPSQQIHADSVDYTGVHPWWRNDDLLATGLFAKVPTKPSLFQETGIMRLEDMDGQTWRTPERAARLLERKYAFAFLARNAGVIEWAWNINPYQPIDNEAVIGFLRPDGTAKPELQVVPELAAFFEAAAPHLDDFEPDPVLAMIPHSRLFLGRPGGADGLKRVIRLLAEHYGVVPTVFTELRPERTPLGEARLVLVPGPQVLEDAAAASLKAASEAGAKVLLTGPIEGNPYGEVAGALAELGVADEGRPVELRERTPWGMNAESAGWATFDRDLREQMKRSTAADLTSLEGNVWHEPLPLEFAREDGPLLDLLGTALEAAGVETQPSDVPVFARLLKAPKAILGVLVNENAFDVERALTVEGRRWRVPVPAGRSRLVLFERGTGEILVVTPGEALRAVE